MLRSNNSARYFNTSKSNTTKRQIFSRLSQKDFDKNPSLRAVINHKRKATLEFLSKELPTIVPTQGVSDEKTYHFIKNLNSFRKHYHDYNKEEEKEIRTHNKVFKENAEFSKRYKLVFKSPNSKHMTLQENNHLNEIKAEYDKMNYKIPQLSLEHNLFKEHPLLLSQGELYRYYLFQRGNPRTESRSLKYLNKLNDEAMPFSKESNENKLKLKHQHQIQKDAADEKEKASNLLLSEIRQSKAEIRRTKASLKTIDNDEFFVTKHLFSTPKPVTSTDAEEHTNVNAFSERNRKSRDHSVEFSNHNRSTRLSSEEKSYLSKCNSISKLKKPLHGHQNDEDSHTIKTERLSHKKTLLEELYDEVKTAELNDLPVFDINNYFLHKKLFELNDNSVRGAFNQIQYIKGKMLNKEYLNDNYRLKGRLATEDPENKCMRTIEQSSQLEGTLLNSERLLVNVTYKNMQMEE